MEQKIWKKSNILKCIIFMCSYYLILICIKTQKEHIVGLVGKDLTQKYGDLIFYLSFFCCGILAFRRELTSCLKKGFGDRRKLMKAAITGLFAAITLMVASAIILDLSGISEGQNEQALDSYVQKYRVISFFTSVLLGPFVEELIFRGILFGAIKGESDNLFRTVIAVLISGLIFGLNHCKELSVPEILSVIPLISMGIIQGILYNKTDNILCPLAVHIAMNFVAFIN